MKYIFLLAFCSAALAMDVPDRREFPIDTSVNPCIDFYAYTCNKVDASFKLPDDRSWHDFAFSDSIERLLTKKKAYFKGLSKTETDNPHEAMVKSFYQACMDKTARAGEEKALVKSTKARMSEIKDREEFLNLLAKNRLTGNEAPVTFGVDNNQDRPTYTDLTLETGWITLPEKSYYENPKLVAELTQLIEKFFTTIQEPNAKAKAKTVVEFEKGLAKVDLTPAEKMDVYAKRTGITKAELLKQFPQLKLDSLLEQVPDSTHIRHMFPLSLEYVNAQMAQLPLADLKTIYLYNALSRHLDEAYSTFFTARFNFEKKNFGGPSVRPDLQERCTREAMHRFVPEVDSVLWQQIFPNFPKEKIVALSEKIRGAIIGSLKENKWLTKGAREEAIHKIQSATLQLVAPDNDEEWNFHPNATYDLKRYIHNQKLYSQLQGEKDLREMKGPISPRRWYMGPLTINAYYDPAFNRFVLPVGILQYPFYDPKSPLEVNLAAVGSVMGHELGHGIDDKGSRYNADGQLKTWMSDSDLKNFSDRTKILIAQFDAAGQKGDLTLGENIGDLVGVTAAHSAAFDGKPYDRQLEKDFFIQYARDWCEVMRPKLVELMIKTNPHALSINRVNSTQLRQQGRPNCRRYQKAIEFLRLD